MSKFSRIAGNVWMGAVDVFGIGLLGLFFIAIGLFALPFGYVSHRADQRFFSHARAVQGTILSQRDNWGRPYGTFVTFQFIADSRSYTVMRPAPQLTIKGNQKVLYDPANPSNAQLANPDFNEIGMGWNLSRIFLAIGGVIMVIGSVWWQITGYRDAKETACSRQHSLHD